MTQAERMAVDQRRRDKLLDMEITKNEQLESELRAARQREHARLVQLEKDVIMKQNMLDEEERIERENVEKLGFVARMAQPRTRAPYVPSSVGALKYALEALETQTQNTDDKYASLYASVGDVGSSRREGVCVDATGVDDSYGGRRRRDLNDNDSNNNSSDSEAVSRRLAAVDAKRKLMIKLREYKRGEKREPELVDPRLKTRQEEMRQEIEAQRKAEEERERFKALQAEKQRKLILFEMEKRAKHRLEQKREGALAQREYEEEVCVCVCVCVCVRVCVCLFLFACEKRRLPERV
jgi:hypothetical protein